MKRLIAIALVLIIAMFAYKAAAPIILQALGISFASPPGYCTNEAMYLFLSVIFTVIASTSLGFIQRK